MSIMVSSNHQPRKHQSKAKMSHTNPQEFHFIGQVQFERQLYTLSTAPIPKQNLAQVKKNIGCRLLNNQVPAIDQRAQDLPQHPAPGTERKPERCLQKWLTITMKTNLHWHFRHTMFADHRNLPCWLWTEISQLSQPVLLS